MDEIIKWTNENSGFLSLLLFLTTFIYGWFSGIFQSLSKKPKLKIRFLEKASFFSFYYTGEKWYNKKLNEEFELHKTGFSVYMSIANIGNKPTSIDKISLGYEKSSIKRKWFKKDIIWLYQWHSIDDFIMNYEDSSLVIRNLRIRNKSYNDSPNDNLGIGESVVGVAYFEQETAWGNLNPRQNKNGEIEIIIKISDVYGKSYKFKTKLKLLPIEKAREFNKHFGNVEKVMKTNKSA